MSKVYVLIPILTDDWNDRVITNDSKGGIRVFKKKKDAENAIELDDSLKGKKLKKFGINGNTYYVTPKSNVTIALICEREIEEL